MTKTTVLICGGGPVGLALAIELGRQHVNCVVVERGDGSVTVPKMSQLSTRTVEFCRRWGVLDQVKRAGWPEDHPGDFIYVTAMTGYELFRQKFPPYAKQGDLGYTPDGARQCPQIFFDPILLRHARTLPAVTLCHNTWLEDFTEVNNGVTAQVTAVANGVRETIEADYLVGCDGFDGTVRKLLQTEYEGSGVLSYSVSIFFRSRELGTLHDKGWGRFYRLVDGTGHWSDLIAIDGRELWRLTLFHVDPEMDIKQFHVERELLRMAGRPFDYEILSVLPWNRRELVAISYGRGRVFLAGDAAHQMSPTGGLGMNTGIGDAVDLAWKLRAMVQGWGGPRLLESYEIERKPVAVQSLAAASDVYVYETSQPANPAIAEDSHAGRAARETFAQALQGRRGAGNERQNESVKLGYRYENSPIVCADPATAAPPKSASVVSLCRTGARAPHGWLSPGVSTLDLFGAGFVLLQFDRRIDVGSLAVAAAERAMPLRVLEINLPAVAALYEKKLVLVRPDGHVAWRGDALPADVFGLVDCCRGAVSGR